MNEEEKRELLRQYAPILRFSGGERFFPMKVEKYIEKCPHLYRGKNRQPGWEKKTTSVARRKKILMEELNTKTYMQLLVREPWLYGANRGLLCLGLLFFILVIILGVVDLANSQFSLLYAPWLDFNYWSQISTETQAGIGDPGLLGTSLQISVWHAIKIFLLAVLIVLWPIVDADRQVHLALVLNLFGMFFFGTIYGTGLGVLALALVTGFWVVYHVFRWRYKSTKWVITGPGTWDWRLLSSHFISLLLIVLVGWLVGYPLGLFTHTLPGMPVITAASSFLFYGLLMTAGSLPKGLWKPVRVLAVMAGMIFAIFVLGKWILEDYYGNGFTVALTICLSGVALVWYALDPFSVIGRGPLKGDNQRERIFGWNGRILGWIWGTIFLYTFLSWLVELYFEPTHPDQLIVILFLYLLTSAINLLVSMVILGVKVGGYILDAFSRLYNSDADNAGRIYDTSIQELEEAKENRYWCYGRVCQENYWVVLQYQYFYAFNDFRSMAGGMNNHEGDWESVSIFLNPCIKIAGEAPDHVVLKPFGVAYSQHHHGEFRFWEEVKKVRVRTETGACDSDHPLVYPALGSHANYPDPGSSTPSMQFSGPPRRVVGVIEKMIQYFRGTPRLGFRGREADVSLEFHSGDGIRIGNQVGDIIYEDECKIEKNLPTNILRRQSNPDGRPASDKDIFGDWQIELIDENTDWVKYRGLWGKMSGVEGENGPQGPMWAGEVPRLRWGRNENEQHHPRKNPYSNLDLLNVLLLDMVQDNDASAGNRIRALQYLTQSAAPLHFP